MGSVEADSRRCGAATRFGVLELRDQFVGIVDAGLGLGGAGLWAAAEPLHLSSYTIAQPFLRALL